MTCYDVFVACFPMIPLPEAGFAALRWLRDENLIVHRENGALTGFAAVDGNALRLLCVLPACRNRGVGSDLLGQAEERVRQGGHTEIIVGGTDSRLVPGMPAQARGFFEKRGYTVGEAYEEMGRELYTFRAADFDLPVPKDTRFGWYDGPLDALHAAVAAVDPEWVRYYRADSPVFCATLEGKVASFCSAEIWENCLMSDGKNKVGAPGCVGTVPAFRRRGIGLKMVALACEELKNQGCDTGFIHYTGVGHWYARLGFQTFLTWHFCKKTLT